MFLDNNLNVLNTKLLQSLVKQQLVGDHITSLMIQTGYRSIRPTSTPCAVVPPRVLGRSAPGR